MIALSGGSGSSSSGGSGMRTVHEKLRDFQCPHCSSRFVAAWVMRRHCKTVHEKVRDHKCPHCPSAFGETGNMRAHVRAVHERHPPAAEAADDE